MPTPSLLTVTGLRDPNGGQPLYRDVHLMSRAIAAAAGVSPVTAAVRTFSKDVQGQPSRLVRAQHQVHA